MAQAFCLVARSATIGSTHAARRTGIDAARIEVPKITIATALSVEGSNGGRPNSKLCIARAARIVSGSPIAMPLRTRANTWRRMAHITTLRAAPKASRMPISRVRSTTA